MTIPTQSGSNGSAPGGAGDSGTEAGTTSQTGKANPRTAKAKSRQRESRDNRSNPSTLNFIRPARAQVKNAPSAARREQPIPFESKDTAESNRLERRLDTEAMPEAVQRRYVRDGRKYFLPSGERAFVDRGLRLTTKSENTTIVRDLVSVASARGWDEIVVGGTKSFRREAWREAKLAGLEVIGYKPTRVEQALLIQSLIGRRDGSEQRPEQPLGIDATERKREDSAAMPSKGSRTSSREESPLITGRLLDHKADHYLHDPDQEMSYYVLLKTSRGEREVWGVDLERAIRQSLTDVQRGDDIGLRAVTRRDFLKKTHTIDDDGRRVPTEVEAHRNGWIVEQRRFFNDRQVLAKTFRDTDLKPREAVKKHPELRGSYLELQAAKLRVEQTVKNPEDRAAFVAQVRERMAAAMERGEPLTPVRMRERATTRDTEPPAKSPSIPDPEHLLGR